MFAVNSFFQYKNLQPNFQMHLHLFVTLSVTFSTPEIIVSTQNHTKLDLRSIIIKNRVNI